MRARHLLLALTLLAVAAPRAFAANNYDDVCTFAAGTSTWSAITTVTGAGVACVGTTNAISNTDLFVVPSGATVNVTGSLAFANQADAGILVQSGGTFNCLRSAGCNLITLPPGGNESTDAIGERVAFRVLSGGTANVVGGFREFGSATPTLQSTQSTTDYLTVGETIPCPVYSTTFGYEPDCAGPGDTDDVWWVYPGHKYASRKGAGTFTAGIPDPEFQAGITQIGATDVAYFFDPAPGDAHVSGDYGYAYKIKQVGDANTSGGLSLPDAAPSCQGISNSPVCIIEIDPRQTSVLAEDLTGATLASRSVIEGALAAAVSQGSRTISLTSTAITATNQYEGYWIRFQHDTEECGDGDATPCRIHPRPYRIMRTVDGGGGADTFTLLDTRGVARAFALTCGAAPCRVWITQGHLGEEGDPISVRAPVTFRAAAGAPREHAAMLLQGNTTLNSVTLDGVGRITVGPGTGIDATFTNGWMIDPASPIFSHWNFTDVAGTVKIDQWSLTGGNRTGSTPEDESGFVIETGTNQATYDIGTLTWRHMATACFSNFKSSVFTGDRILRCQFPTLPTGSAQATTGIRHVDGTSQDPTTDLEINHFEWVGGQDSEAGVLQAGFNTATTGDLIINNGLILGPTSLIVERQDSGQDNRAVKIRNMLIAGGDHSVVSGNYATFQDIDWEHVTLREQVTSGGGASPLSNFTRRPNFRIANSFINDWNITSTSTASVLSGNGEITNLAVYNMRHSAAGSRIFNIGLSAATIRLNRMSFVWPSYATSTMTDVLDVGITSGITLNGLHIEGFKGIRFLQFSEAEMQGMTKANWCFFDPGTTGSNAYTQGASTLDELPATTYVDRSAGLWERDGWMPVVRPGSVGNAYGCGAYEGAGITRQSIMLSASGIRAVDEALQVSTVSRGGGDAIFTPGIFQ